MSKLMNVLCKFRDDVKNNAKDPDAAKILFKLSDELRDDVLPHLGIQIEDKGNAASIWKFDDPAKLLKKRAEAIAEKEKKEEEKRLRKELDLKKKSTPAKDWFKVF